MKYQVIPSLKADGHAILVHGQLPIASFGPTPHEVACANFAQNKRCQAAADAMNKVTHIAELETLLHKARDFLFASRESFSYTECVGLVDEIDFALNRRKP